MRTLLILALLLTGCRGKDYTRMPFRSPCHKTKTNDVYNHLAETNTDVSAIARDYGLPCDVSIYIKDEKTAFGSKSITLDRAEMVGSDIETIRYIADTVNRYLNNI